MDILLKRILDLKNSRGLTDLQFQKDLGLYATAVSEWKSGKSKSYQKHLPKIAKYFNVSADYLLNGSANTMLEKDSSDLDKQLEGVDFAFFGEVNELDDDDKADVLEFIRYKKMLKAKKEHEKKK